MLAAQDASYWAGLVDGFDEVEMTVNKFSVNIFTFKEAILIRCGVRQGHILSPLLFHISSSSSL